MRFHEDMTLPERVNSVFVFGSNLAGYHGAGSAKIAHNHYSAKIGIGRGRVGRSYAIPTKKADVKTPRPLEHIKNDVDNFLEYARSHSHTEFFVTRIGCGFAGYTDAEIAPMFKGASDNCNFPEEWRPYVT